MARYRNLDSANERIDVLFHRNQATLATLRIVQERLGRMDAVLRSILWHGRGVETPYTRWVNAQIERALGPSERESD
ncbi:MAG TPA: hypothetical protein VNM48_22430 [Chloroflexota bacterium]|nr:hypothetical protein [Chloroflexota bacterium]